MPRDATSHAGAAGDGSGVTAYPDPGSGFVPIQQRHQGWPAGAKVLEVNLALSKGRVLRGRVVEAGSGRPVAAASVVYEPGRGQPPQPGRLPVRQPGVD